MCGLKKNHKKKNPPSPRRGVFSFNCNTYLNSCGAATTVYLVQVNAF
jgi:hypothetical protein